MEARISLPAAGEEIPTNSTSSKSLSTESGQDKAGQKREFVTVSFTLQVYIFCFWAVIV